jgi:hypothetical protein
MPGCMVSFAMSEPASSADVGIYPDGIYSIACAGHSGVQRFTSCCTHALTVHINSRIHLMFFSRAQVTSAPR